MRPSEIVADFVDHEPPHAVGLDGRLTQATHGVIVHSGILIRSFLSEEQREIVCAVRSQSPGEEYVPA